MALAQLPRDEFLEDIWPKVYEPGQHVLTVGQTQLAGKTQLNWQLLKALHWMDVDKTAFIMKPRDKTVARWSNELGFKETATWPPPSKWWWQQEPPGRTLWPGTSFDTDKDNEHYKNVFHRALMSHYSQGNSILLLDEVYGLCDIGLSSDLITILSRGSGMGCGAWMSNQRGAGTNQASIPGHVWSQPAHYFLSHSSHKSDREKYKDMTGDLDPDLIDYTARNLRRYEFLYVNSAGQACIIGS